MNDNKCIIMLTVFINGQKPKVYNRDGKHVIKIEYLNDNLFKLHTINSELGVTVYVLINCDSYICEYIDLEDEACVKLKEALGGKL